MPVARGMDRAGMPVARGMGRAGMHTCASQTDVTSVSEGFGKRPSCVSDMLVHRKEMCCPLEMV